MSREKKQQQWKKKTKMKKKWSSERGKWDLQIMAEKGLMCSIQEIESIS